MDAKTPVENGYGNKSNLEVIAPGNFVVSLLIGVAFSLIAFPSRYPIGFTLRAL
jgi:hypothetical protein